MNTNINFPLLVCLLLTLPAGLFSQTVDPDYVDGWLYVKVEDSSSLNLDPYNNTNAALNLIFSTFGVDTTYKTFRSTDPLVNKIFTLEFSNISAVTNLVGQLAALPSIEYAERVPYLTTTETNYLPNDLVTQQWGLVKINAELGWDITKGDTNVVIAIVDNAVQIDHQDLIGNLWKNSGEIPGNFLDDDLNGYTDDYHGYDVANYDADPNPPAGTVATDAYVHGTHCAGIASASTDNNTGIAGLGFNCRIMAVKASLDSDDGTWVARGFEGVDYAVSAGADIISMSWGGKGVSLTGQAIIQLAKARGVTMLASAGNADESIPVYPAAYDGVIAVGATNTLDQKSGFSNYGTYVDVMAPGSQIFSTLADTSLAAYGSLSGTSMSTPMVAGLAGLVLSMDTSQSPSDIEQAIKDGCENIDLLNPQYVGMMGAGRINAFNTLSLFVGRENPLPSDVSIWPNPFSEELKIQVSGRDEVELGIYDLNGRLLSQERLPAGQKSARIQTENLGAGLFILEIREGQRVWQRKIMKR